jgi:cytochrome c-type biogenesis protein CcmH/NrfG
LAEVYEVELGDMKKALEAYEKAAEWFEGDNAEAYGSHDLSTRGIHLNKVS